MYKEPKERGFPNIAARRAAKKQHGTSYTLSVPQTDSSKII
jgi:hypothetical protein